MVPALLYKLMPRVAPFVGLRYDQAVAGRSPT